MTSGELRVLVADIAPRYGLPDDLVYALIQVESSGNPYAWNPEPRYRYFWDVAKGQPFRPVSMREIANVFPPKDFPCLAGDPDQEWWGQQASWGLMQIVGAVARELGYVGHYLTELVNPAVNLPYGCLKLGGDLVWANEDTRKALAAYNAGRGNWDSTAGRAYAAKVLAMMEAA